MRPSLLVAAVVGAVAVAAVATPPPRVARRSDLRPLLLRPSVSSTVAKSQLPMLLDLYWLRALNAVADFDSEPKNRGLYEYSVVITEIDPRFFQAYTYLGLNVPLHVGRQWALGDLASDIFRRGLRAFPTSMRLHMYLGFTLFHQEKKYREAGEVFAAASKLPDALSFMAPLATRLLSHAGDAREALDLAKQLLDETDDESAKAELEQRVKDLEIEVPLQDIDRAAERFASDKGRKATNLAELVREGYYQGPVSGDDIGQLSLDENGKGTSTALERRLTIYE